MSPSGTTPLTARRGTGLWRWPAIESWMQSFTPAGLVTTAARVQSLSMSFFAIVFVLASMTVMLALHTILAED